MIYPKPRKKTEAEKKQARFDKWKNKKKKIVSKVKKKREITVRKLIKQCDTIFSLVVRKRDKRCQRCGNELTLQNSHTISRTNYFLRWDEQNCIALCYKCHIYFWHKSPLEAAKWFMETFPDRYAYLMSNKEKIAQRVRQDYVELLYNLRKRLRELDQT